MFELIMVLENIRRYLSTNFGCKAVQPSLDVLKTRATSKALAVPKTNEMHMLAFDIFYMTHSVGSKTFFMRHKHIFSMKVQDSGMSCTFSAMKMHNAMHTTEYMCASDLICFDYEHAFHPRAKCAVKS